MSEFYRYRKDSTSRKPGVVSFKEALDRLLDSFQIQDKFDETYIPANWEKIMGRPVSSRTKNIYVKGSILYLQLDSAPLREELVRAKSKLIKNINAEVGKDVITDIVYY